MQTRRPDQFALEALEQRILLSAELLSVAPTPSGHNPTDAGTALEMSLTPGSTEVVYLNNADPAGAGTAATDSLDGGGAFAGMTAELLPASDDLQNAQSATPDSQDPDPQTIPITPHPDQVTPVDTRTPGSLQSENQATLSDAALTPTVPQSDQQPTNSSDPANGVPNEQKAETIVAAKQITNEAQPTASDTALTSAPGTTDFTNCSTDTLTTTLRSANGPPAQGIDPSDVELISSLETPLQKDAFSLSPTASSSSPACLLSEFGPNRNSSSPISVITLDDVDAVLKQAIRNWQSTGISSELVDRLE